MRPVLGDGRRSHGWSDAGPLSPVSVQLGALVEGQASLLRCAAPADAAQTGALHLSLQLCV